jgi:glycosyltransferase involved in cell wall biosynthesis
MLRDIYSVADIFVMSSVSEPFGLTALEAAHHGDALILTKQSGVSEVVWSVMKYDYWDEDKLANELVTVAESEALMGMLRAGIAREYARISWADVAVACERVYNRLMSKSRVAA